MKHSIDFPVDGGAGRGLYPVALGYLPDAPLPMPKQMLERRAGWLAALRSLIAGTFARN